jgi:hypothetical protein
LKGQQGEAWEPRSAHPIAKQGKRNHARSPETAA